MEDKETKSGQLNIELSEEMAEGVYSNLVILTHSHSEFIVDFIQAMPGAPKAKVKSRVILTPQHAKRLFLALGDNIEKFEEVHGHIREVKAEKTVVPMNFGGPTTQA